MELTNTVDIFEAIGGAFFLLGTVMAVYNAYDAWRNMVVGIDSAEPPVMAIGVDDFGRSAIKLLLLSLIGLVMEILLMLIPFQALFDTVDPATYAVGIAIRVGLVIVALGVLLESALSFWLRRFLAARRLVTAPPPGYPYEGVHHADIAQNTAKKQEEGVR